MTNWLNNIKRYQQNLPAFFQCCHSFLSRFSAPTKTNPIISQQSVYKLIVSSPVSKPKELENLVLPTKSALLHSPLFISAIKQLGYTLLPLFPVRPVKPCLNRNVPLSYISELFTEWIGILQAAVGLDPFSLPTKTAEEPTEQRTCSVQDLVDTLKYFIVRLSKSNPVQYVLPRMLPRIDGLPYNLLFYSF